MLLKLPKGNNETIDLDLTAGIALLAGPNAVGKTHLLRSALNQSGHNQSLAYSPRLHRPTPISLDGEHLTPLLITTEALQNIAVGMSADRASFTESGIYSQIEEALRSEASGNFQGNSLLTILTSDEKELFRTGSSL